MQIPDEKADEKSSRVTVVENESWIRVAEERSKTTSGGLFTVAPIRSQTSCPLPSLASMSGSHCPRSRTEVTENAEDMLLSLSLSLPLPLPDCPPCQPKEIAHGFHSHSLPDSSPALDSATHHMLIACQFCNCNCKCRPYASLKSQGLRILAVPACPLLLEDFALKRTPDRTERNENRLDSRRRRE